MIEVYKIFSGKYDTTVTTGWLVDMWRDIEILEVINLAYISHKSAMTLENIILQTE